MLISERLKNLRGLETQKKFSERIGVSAQAVINYEKYGRIPNSRVVKQICERLGVSELWLLNGEGPMYKKQDENLYPNREIPPVSDSQCIEITSGEMSSSLYSDRGSSDTLILSRYIKTVEENAALIRENGDLRVDTERYKARIRELEREVEALRKAMKPAAVPGMDRQGVA